MKELAKIFACIVATIVAGALLAPPLYWAAQALATGGIFTWLGEVEFQKFFNRAALIAFIAMLWPLAKSLRIGGWRDLGIEKNPAWWKDALFGLLIGAAVVALLAGLLLWLDVYRYKRDPNWGAVPKVALSAVCVALLEEALFRGVVLGVARRTMNLLAATVAVSALFAIVHFLKPNDAVEVGTVHWWSGFALVPHVFHRFSEPLLLLGGFSTLFVLGALLAYATIRTRSLWVAIGLHAGIVLVKMSFNKVAKLREPVLPWVGPELELGLAPIAGLLLAGVAVWWWSRAKE